MVHLQNPLCLDVTFELEYISLVNDGSYYFSIELFQKNNYLSYIIS